MVLMHASAQSETRTLTKLGAVALVLFAIIPLLYIAGRSLAGKPRDVISVAIDAPFVGQGVAAGTPVIMHGVKIGQVVSVSNIAHGGVRLLADFQMEPSRGLTDTIGIDYRPSNYFGVTGINVIPGQRGQPLRSGMQISITPKGNFALQALLYRLGELSNGVLNHRLVSVIDRATRYVDGLNPLLETMLVVSNSVAKVQTVRTERLLRNATGVSVAFPGFVDSLISTGNNFLYTYFVDFDSEEFKKNYRYYPVLDDEHKKYLETNERLSRETRSNDEYYAKHFIPLFSTAVNSVFLPVGYLLGAHINDLFPILESVRGLTDTVPKILSPDSFAYTVTELRKRFERMYAGSGDQRALQVRIILDRLPGVAAPLGLPAGGSS